MISQEDFESNYYYILNQSTKSELSTLDKAEEDSYFDEVYFGIELYVPKINEHLIFKDISFSYHFELYKNEKNQCEIVFNNENRPTLNITSSEIPSDSFELLENLYKPQLVTEKTFEDFFTKTIGKEIFNKFKTIDEQYFFEDKINKKRVVLNKGLLKDLQKNFFIEISHFLSAIKENDWSKVLVSQSHVEQSEINDLMGCLKNLNIKFNHLKLTETLLKKDQEIKQKFKV